MENIKAVITELRGQQPITLGFNNYSEEFDSPIADVEQWMQDENNPADVFASYESCRGFEWPTVIFIDHAHRDNSGVGSNSGMRAMAKFIPLAVRSLYLAKIGGAQSSCLP